MADLYESIKILREACKNPRAKLDQYLSEGKKVVGCFPPYTPEELVHASGMIPMGLWGGRTELALAKSYLPAFACPIMQADMEFGLKGAYQGLSAVIIPAACDTLRCMTQNWRFGVSSIPMIPIVYPQNRACRASVDYLISEYENVLLMLSTITGNMMSEKSLCNTIEIYNEHNAVMRKFAEISNLHLDIITPVIRHAVMKSAFFFEKSEHSAIVKDITEGLEQLPSHPFSAYSSGSQNFIRQLMTPSEPVSRQRAARSVPRGLPVSWIRLHPCRAFHCRARRFRPPPPLEGVSVRYWRIS